MKETQFQVEFGKWIMQNKPLYTEFYEYKVTNGGTFNLKQWREKQPHQPRSLKQIRGNVGVYHKISDQSMGQKPIDAFFAVDEESFLVIWFNKYKEFFMIPIQLVPETDSISYKYCVEHFEIMTLDIKKKRSILDF